MESKQTSNAKQSPGSLQRMVSPLDDKTKLLLLKEPVRRTIKTLRTLADQCDCLDDDGSCDLANMALWLESVLHASPAYCSKRDIGRAKAWDKRANDPS